MNGSVHENSGSSGGQMRIRLLVITHVLIVVLSVGNAFAQSFRLNEATVDDVHAALTSGQTTCRAIVQGYLNRIEAYDQRGPTLNAVKFVNPEALTLADDLDAVLETSGLVGSLHCIPVLLKDQVEASGMPTTYGSALFEGFVSTRDATIVERLKKAGAIILAKTNMGEFASRYIGSAFGLIRNPYDPMRNPSGSSGGTGVGVASNFGMVGIGEDTGGSIRGPAAVSSLVGLRPTVPLVSRFGMMPANPTTDTLGPITRTVKDAAVLLDVLVGYDPNDPITAHSVGHIPGSYVAGLDLEDLGGFRIGVIRQPMDPKTNPDADDYQQVRTVIDGALANLESLGAELVDPATIDELEEVDAAYLRNNFETEEATNTYLAAFPNAPVKTLRDILLSGVVTPWRAKGLMDLVGRSTDEYGYLQVLHDKERFRRNVLMTMATHKLDALVYATFDHVPSLIADDALTNSETDDAYGLGNNRYLSPVIGFPAVTVPAGFTTSAMPVGIEFLGRPFTEALLLRLAHAFEQATHFRRPPRSTPSVDGQPSSLR